MKEIPPVEYFRENLLYDQNTGYFYWKTNRLNGKGRAGDRCEQLDSKGYYQIKLNGVKYLAHRVAVYMIENVWPDGLIDHKDRITTNNAYLNLRKASKMENAFNNKLSAANSSGVKGVRLRKGRYITYVTKDGKQYSAGSFSTLTEAAQAVAELREKLHGQFANHVQLELPLE
jgi:hypothetical protein|nr:MAG TPA: endonuclease [Caudoviricetes sp.]